MKIKDPGSSNHLLLALLSLILLESLGTFCIILFSGSSEPGRVFLLGYSLPRLILMVIVLIFGFFSGALLLKACQSKEFSKSVRQTLSRPVFGISTTVAFLAAGFFLIWSWTGIPGALGAYAYRLQPFLWLLLLIAAQALAYHLLVNGWPSWKPWAATLRRVFSGCDRWLHTNIARMELPQVALTLLFCLSAPLLLQNILRYSMPVGYAGLYSLMSEEIAVGHFQLPATIPYYGPGGIPFIYPPLAFYIAAIITSITRISFLEYTRFAGPILYWVCLAPLFLLSRRLSKSTWVGIVSAFFMAFYTRSYLVHGTAAGMVRALGLLFALFGLYFLTRVFQRPTWFSILFASLGFSGAILTHPIYAMFFAVGALALTLSNDNALSVRFFKRLMLTAEVVLIAAAISMPWWYSILQQHSLQVFIQAFTSQDQTGLLALLLQPAKLIAYAFAAFQPISSTAPLLAGGALLGLLYALFTRRFTLPIWFALAVWAARGYDIFLLPVCAILAAWILVTLAQFVISKQGGSLWRGIAFVSIPLMITYMVTFQAIAQVKPSITPNTLALADWIAQNSPSSSRYLLVPQTIDEAEWLPYLLRRTPIAASWGSEWTGNFSRQLSLLYDIQSCREIATVSCLQTVITASGQQPDFLIINAIPTNLLPDLQKSNWKLLQSEGTYQVWQQIFP